MGELGCLRVGRRGSSPCLAGCVVRLRRSGVALWASAALPGGWALVAAPWGCFDGAKVRFCSKENRFFGILHDEKAADCGGVLQACGREPRASASLQPDALRPCPDGGASLGAGGAPLPAATRSHAPSPTTCGDGSGSERERGALRWRQWRERAGERTGANSPRRVRPSASVASKRILSSAAWGGIWQVMRM